MEDIKSQLANRLKEANNVLVSVTTNPSVDQFAAAIGLTLMLNKLGKHATTVFSGKIPSTIEFLQPEKVVEQNTDSLRDFIISLDKSKADKLRYKIEDNFVKIFITPYHASISEKDLVFSQGDFNVDVVVGLGVHQREELDQAITAHGRILHDATVTTINTQPPSNLGSINWADGKASSLCEMLVNLADLLAKQGLFDTQISNALLTGIVAETQRFSNQKTTSNTMSVSSKLLASGANQQLVAKELTPKPAPPPPPPPKPALPAPPKPLDKAAPKPKQPSAQLPKLSISEEPTEKKEQEGVLEIDHGQPKVAQVLIDDQGTLQTLSEDVVKDETPKDDDPPKDQTPPPPEPPTSLPPSQTPTPPPATLPPVATYIPPPLIPIPADTPAGSPDAPPEPQQPTSPAPPTGQVTESPTSSNSNDSLFQDAPKLVLEPPSIVGTMNANEAGDTYDADPLSPSPDSPADNAQPLLSHESGPASVTDQSQPPLPPVFQPPQVGDGAMPNLSDVRNAVDAALSNSPATVANQPLESLNSQSVGLNLNPTGEAPMPTQPTDGYPLQPTQPTDGYPPMPTPPNDGYSLQPTPPTGGYPPPQPQQPYIDPSGLESGASIPTSVITPTVPPPEPEPSSAPPVPPPLISLDDNSLPPSFTAL